MPADAWRRIHRPGRDRSRTGHRHLDGILRSMAAPRGNRRSTHCNRRSTKSCGRSRCRLWVCLPPVWARDQSNPSTSLKLLVQRRWRWGLRGPPPRPGGDCGCGRDAGSIDRCRPFSISPALPAREAAGGRSAGSRPDPGVDLRPRPCGQGVRRANMTFRRPAPQAGTPPGAPPWRSRRPRATSPGVFLELGALFDAPLSPTAVKFGKPPP